MTHGILNLPGFSPNNRFSRQAEFVAVEDQSSVLFSVGKSPPCDFHSALEKVFGDQTAAIIDDLYAFQQDPKNRNSAFYQDTLTEFLGAFAFSGPPGRRRMTLRSDVDAQQYISHSYEQMAPLARERREFPKLRTIADRRIQEGLEFLRGLGLFTLAVIGIVAAVGFLGGYFTLPLALYFAAGGLAASLFAGHLGYKVHQSFAKRQSKDPPDAIRVFCHVMATYMVRKVEDLSDQHPVRAPWTTPACRRWLDSLALSPCVDVDAKGADGMTLLHSAAQSGDELLCLLLLEAGAHVNAKDDKGLTPFYYAAYQYREESVCRVLLKAGADVNIKCPEGFSLLYGAILAGNEHWCAFLLEAGADPNGKTLEGKTLLHVAIKTLYQSGEHLLPICDLLLKAGADVNAKDRKGETPLRRAMQRSWYATWEKREPLCRLLVAAGADVNKPWKNGNTPLWEAIWEGNEALCALLLEEGAKVNVEVNGATYLWRAIGQGQVGICRLLIEHGANVHGRGPYPIFETYLVKAAREGGPDICRLLLDAGLDVNERNSRENYSIALYAAIQSQKADICKMFLEAGADMFCRAEEYLLWQYALQTENRDVCQVFLDGGLRQALLDGGLDVNAEDRGGMTPLLRAASCGQEELLSLLLQVGANPSWKDRGGRPLLYIVLEKLRSSGPDRTPMKVAIFRELLQAGANMFEGSCNFGRYPIWQVVLDTYDREICQVFLDGGLRQALLDGGLDVNEKGRWNKIPFLVIAVFLRHEELFGLLLRAGADVAAFKSYFLSMRNGDPRKDEVDAFVKDKLPKVLCEYRTEMIKVIEAYVCKDVAGLVCDQTLDQAEFGIVP